MKKHQIGMVLVCWLAMSSTASAGVTDWPVIGQVFRVGQCAVGGTGQLVASLLSHLTAWGTELVTTVGQCALHTTNEARDIVEDVVTPAIPFPDSQPTETSDAEVPPQ